MVDRHSVYGYALLNRGAARFRHELGCLQRITVSEHRELIETERGSVQTVF